MSQHTVLLWQQPETCCYCSPATQGVLLQQLASSCQTVMSVAQICTRTHETVAYRWPRKISRALHSEAPWKNVSTTDSNVHRSAGVLATVQLHTFNGACDLVQHAANIHRVYWRIWDLPGPVDQTMPWIFSGTSPGIMALASVEAAGLRACMIQRAEYRFALCAVVHPAQS